MRLEAGQVAVVTGAASGIGLGLSNAFADRSLRVVMADVEAEALERAAAELSERGATVLAHRVDVRDPGGLDELARRTLDAFGRVDVVCNNAGVVTPRQPVWEQPYEDWQWTIEVNLLGVANGIRSFVPHLIAARRGHIVNTASIAGLSTIPGGGNGAYSATKHAVVGLSETLRLELDLVAPEVGVTVLCPGPVPSRIHDAARNRPADRQPSGRNSESLPRPDFGLALQPVSADQVGVDVLAAVEENRMYLLTAPDAALLARKRTERLLSQLPALPT